MIEFKDVKTIIDSNMEQQIKALAETIQVASVAGDQEEGFPFGQQVGKALLLFLEKGESMGFSPKNVDNYGGHLTFAGNSDEGKQPEIMGIIVHLDVVPEGNDWDYPPFGGEIHNGRMYGRGTTDDKGPAIAALYAMYALKQAGFKPEKDIRLILGLDEETNWYGMDYYLSKETPPTFGFTPDADFPAIHGEKGILVFDLAKKLGKPMASGLDLRTIKGGFAANMVADSARAVVRSDKVENYQPIIEKASQLRESGQMAIKTRKIGKNLEITVEGVSSHGARPEMGVNAISHMMKFLGELNFNNEDVKDFISFYNNHIGEETDGKSLGCGLEDKPSGNTVVNVGMIDVTTKAASLTINVRYPVTKTDEDVYNGLGQVTAKYDLGIIKGKHQKPIYIPADDPFIETLMDIYKEHTGDVESKPLVIGGGTYARAFDNVVAFGSRFPHEAECAHQKNEFIDLESLRTMTYIYADAIFRLTGGDQS